MKTLFSDFNSYDDDGSLVALTEDAWPSPPVAGEDVRVNDAERNVCFGTVVSVDRARGLVHVALDRDTFQTVPEPHRVATTTDTFTVITSGLSRDPQQAGAGAARYRFEELEAIG
jgi:hypothetical protein